MAVRALRRLSAPSGISLYDEMTRQALHAVYFRRDVDRLEREHPDLILRDGANILLAQPAGVAKLAYAYESDRVFTELFPAMLEKLLPRARRALRADTVRFRLSHNPSRPIVEPVLKRLHFRPSRDWIQFDVPVSRAPRPPALAGVRFRDATIDDLEDVAAVDREGFPNTPIALSRLRETLETGEEQTTLAVRGREVVGICAFAQPDPGLGYIHSLAVREVARGGGVGEALTLRAMRALARAGARTVSLTTEADNTPAIRLYRKLGFQQAAAGRDYERPADRKAVERLAAESRGTLIKFGGWR